MTTIASATDQDAIVSEIEIAAPPERVFHALTDPAQLMQWWNSDVCKAELWEMDPRAGGKWRFKTSKSSLNVNGVDTFEVFGEVIEFDPPRLLTYSWLANWHDKPAQRTTVRWELSKAGAGTRVKVTHSGLANLPVARKDYAGGWPGVVEQLKKFVEQI